MAGRVWRFPFDDEVYTLQAIERSSAGKLFTFYLGGSDVHPPLQYLYSFALRHLGLSEAGMRLCSLVMTALALALFQILALQWIAQRNREPVSLSTRIVAVLLFGLSALAVSQGDAIHWYPLFAFEIALFVTIYLAGGNNAARLWSAVPLGIAASTNFLAVIVILPFAVYRYGFQRQHHLSFEVVFWAVAGVFASFGIYTAYSLFTHHFGMVGTQIGNGILRAGLTDALGFFGGDALGIGQAWIIFPAVVVSGLAMAAAVDRKQPDAPIHLLLLLMVASVVLVLAGFAKPRSFLYLVPLLAAVLALYIDRQSKLRPRTALLLTVLLVTGSVSAIANINGGTHPFKRNSSIPFQDIVDFIDSNGTGRQLILSTDPIVPRVMQRRPGSGDRCAGYFQAQECLSGGRAYDSVFIVSGHSDKSGNVAAMRRFNEAVTAATDGRSKIATIHVGRDDDAALKTWLTGVALDNYILTVELYR
ncbi:MAG: hypothetical protein WAM62_12585 [Pseudolabrys sp.]